MPYRNPYKYKIQNLIHSFVNMFIALNSSRRTLTDDQMECMQFGICSFAPKDLEQIPYFHN